MQTKLYIGGEFVDGLAGRTMEVINPADASVLAWVAEAGAEDIDRAVAAAQHAFPGWAMNEYTSPKSVWINVNASLPDWYNS